jgi:hypothetical protein
MQSARASIRGLLGMRNKSQKSILEETTKAKGVPPLSWFQRQSPFDPVLLFLPHPAKCVLISP